jgi:diguanylate cyclase (GGDEF)-like protein
MNKDLAIAQSIPDRIAATGTILVVDDNPANLHVLFSVLTQNGYGVRCVKSGAMALSGIQSVLPDLILLDICMPNMDGYEVCQQLKADRETSDIPVIFLSALNQSLDKVKAFEVGGADYITKPFQMAEVLARVKHQLTIRNLRRQQQQLIMALEEANQKLQTMVALDSLTQVANRRRFDEYLTLEWQRLAQERSPLSLILADIDHFKQYNDTCGHLAGDRCLQIVAQTIRWVVEHPAALVARYGGEEFAILLPNIDLATAAQLAETIRIKVEQLTFIEGASLTHDPIHLSLGVASRIPSPKAALQELVMKADHALYRAKAQGRNRVCTCNC